MARRKRSNFRDKVANNSHKQKTQGSAYGYLRIPKGVDIFKEEAGTRVSLDFLPYVVTDENHMDRDDSVGIAVPGDLWYKKPFLIHRNVGINNDIVVCPVTMGKKCPICEYRAKLFKDGAGKDETDVLKPSRRNLYIVVPIGHKEYEQKPHLWDISQYLFQEMLNDEIEDDPDNAIFPDLEEGLTLRIRFREDSIGSNKFASTSRIDFKERKKSYDESILDEVPNLDECLEVYSYEKLNKLFLELDDIDSPGGDEDDGLSDDAPDNDNSDDVPFDGGAASDNDNSDDASDNDNSDDASDNDNSGDDEKEDDNSGDDEKEDDNICVACQGTGKNSKGKKCRICKGTGKKPVKTKDRCPYGHKFGKDTDEFPECDECEKWDDCIDAQS